MQIVLTVPYLAQHDAIGNDVFITKQCLKDAGYKVTIFAPLFDEVMKSETISSAEFESLIKSPDVFWIYHHGVYWSEAEAWITKAKCKILLRYHNVTPPSFFAPFDPEGTHATHLGRKQTESLVRSKRLDHYIPASPYNSSELEELGAAKENISIIAPYNKLEDFDLCDLNQQLYDSLRQNGLINVLMVGRLSPNKGHIHLIRTLENYFEMFGPKMNLILVGSITQNFIGYAEYLLERINSANLGAYATLAHSVSFNDLYTYYRAANVFLCLSEHEGFCLPIIEAQYLDLPVLTVNRCALGDTVGEGQIKWDYYDPEFFAKAVHRMAGDKELQTAVIKSGRENVEKYSRPKITERYLNLLQTLSLF